MSRRRRILFVKHALAYPRVSGDDVPCFELARALRRLGHDVALATAIPLDDTTRAELDVPWFPLAGQVNSDVTFAHPLSYLQERFRSFWGIPIEVIEQVARTAADFRADAVIGVGLDALPLTAATHDAVRVWYAADEWILHHLSLFRPLRKGAYGELRAAVLKGLYERCYASSIDRAWVVSAREQHAMRRYAGIKNVDVVANGVDTEYFAPTAVVPEPYSAVFWGRLDFGPNVQALEWFCDRIWPALRARAPSASLTIIGFNPAAEVRARAGRNGIAVSANVADIRPIVAASQIALLPMISGGGIKNKLLEAAALGKPIVCTSRACGGLRRTPPGVIIDDAHCWIDAIATLWEDRDRRGDLARAARAWVLEHHTWEAAAREALAGLDASR